MLAGVGVGTMGDGEGMGINFHALLDQRKLVFDAELWPTAMQKFAGAQDTSLSPPLSSSASNLAPGIFWGAESFDPFQMTEYTDPPKAVVGRPSAKQKNCDVHDTSRGMRRGVVATSVGRMRFAEVAARKGLATPYNINTVDKATAPNVRTLTRISREEGVRSMIESPSPASWFLQRPCGTVRSQPSR
jgi:hypothetical protein